MSGGSLLSLVAKFQHSLSERSSDDFGLLQDDCGVYKLPVY